MFGLTVLLARRKSAPTVKAAKRQHRHHDAAGQRRDPHDVEEGAYGRFGPSAVDDSPGVEGDQKIQCDSNDRAGYDSIGKLQKHRQILDRPLDGLPSRSSNAKSPSEGWRARQVSSTLASPKGGAAWLTAGLEGRINCCEFLKKLASCRNLLNLSGRPGIGVLQNHLQ